MLCVEVTRDVPVHHTHEHNLFSNCTAHSLYNKIHVVYSNVPLSSRNINCNSSYHMRSHSVWLSTAPKLEKCVTCPRSISKNQTHSAWHLICLCHVHVCDEEELQFIFLEDSGTLELLKSIKSKKLEF
jgi:hypothetical protein